MGALVKYELKKLFNKKMNIVVIISCLFLIILLFSLSGTDFLATDENGKSYKGKEAIRLRKEQIKEISGILTNESLVEEIKNLQELNNNPDNIVINSYGEKDLSREVYNKYLNNRLNLLTNINHVYGDNYLNGLSTLNLENKIDFYENREKRIEELIVSSQDYKGRTYTEKEKEYWIEKSKGVNIPFEYDFYFGYSNLYSTYEMLIIGLIAICICIASVFSGEYQNGTDKILLTTKYGKSKGATTKIIASYIFASIVFAIYLIFAILAVLLMFGTDGGNLPIQLLNILSPYNLTFAQSLMYNIFISYTVLFGIVGLTLFLSSKIKNPISTLVIDICIVMLPVFLSVKSGFGIINKILFLMPYNAIYSNFTKMVSYKLGSIVFDLPTMTIFSYICIMIISLIFAKRIYSKHQVE